MVSSSAPVASTAQSNIAKWPSIVALAFGILIVFGAGFSHPMALHNATHDTRHAFGLPCH
jgi:cobalt transporter subunit CbtB